LNPKYFVAFLVLLITTLASVAISPAFATHDLDRDGVPDEIDKCPNLQEDHEGSLDGCPSDFVPWYDEDYDGIEDHIDQCPNLKENYNKFQDYDGCPDNSPETDSSGVADTDGDGFIDLVDSCPNQPETFNGILDRDGCPDTFSMSSDRDRDGVPDAIDSCPLSAEVYNRYQDEDGCPDSVIDSEFID